MSSTNTCINIWSSNKKKYSKHQPNLERYNIFCKTTERAEEHHETAQKPDNPCIEV
jgi:hypothetical protein